MKLTDPAKGKSTSEERKAERLKAWKRPKLKKDREAGTAERKQDWEVRNGYFNSANTGNS